MSPSIFDRMILVVIPETTQNDYNDWINNYVDITWINELPAAYLNLESNNTDPEPIDCNPQQWREVKTSGR